MGILKFKKEKYFEWFRRSFSEDLLLLNILNNNIASWVYDLDDEIIANEISSSYLPYFIEISYRGHSAGTLQDILRIRLMREWLEFIED